MMRWLGIVGVMVTGAGSSGCMMGRSEDERQYLGRLMELAWGERAVHFTNLGKDRPTAHETENLRIRLLQHFEVDADVRPVPPLAAALVMENKRAHMARIVAQGSCLVDPKRGASNLLFGDRLLPSEGWLILNQASPFATVSLPFIVAQRHAAPDPGTSQRLLLQVDWDDGLTERLDLAFEVIERKPPEEASR